MTIHILCCFRLSIVFLFLALSSLVVWAQLTVTPTTWKVIGLDSNTPGTGPDSFPVGARICNTSGAAITNVTGTQTPVSGGGSAASGYDRALKAIRWRVTAGTLSPTAPHNTGSLSFTVQIR